MQLYRYDVELLVDGANVSDENAATSATIQRIQSKGYDADVEGGLHIALDLTFRGEYDQVITDKVAFLITCSSAVHPIQCTSNFFTKQQKKKELHSSLLSFITAKSDYYYSALRSVSEGAH